MRQRHEAHVVVVERVRGGAVGERRVAGARRAARCRARGTGRRRRAVDDALDDARGRLGGAGQRHADRVEQRARAAAARAAARRRRRRRRTRRGSQRRSVDVRIPGCRCAAMKRCLMNTQSSGGFDGRRRLRHLRDDRPAGPRASASATRRAQLVDRAHRHRRRDAHRARRRRRGRRRARSASA